MAVDSQAQVPQPRAMPDTSGCNAYLDSPVLAPVLDRWLTASARQPSRHADCFLSEINE